MLACDLIINEHFQGCLAAWFPNKLSRESMWGSRHGASCIGHEEACLGPTGQNFGFGGECP